VTWYRWLHRRWCMLFHQGSMYPINGRYVCDRCLEEYLIEFEQEALKQGALKR